MARVAVITGAGTGVGRAAALTQAETSLYFSRIAIASRFWSANDVEKADQMLEACPPGLRDWESL